MIMMVIMIFTAHDIVVISKDKNQLIVENKMNEF